MGRGAGGSGSWVALPNRQEMLGMLINTLKAPARGVISGLSGNLGGLVEALEAKAS